MRVQSETLMELLRPHTHMARWFMERTQMKTKRRKALWTRIPGQRCKVRASEKAVRSIERISKAMAVKLRAYSKLKKVVLKSHPWCQACENARSTTVHHRIPRSVRPDLLLSKANLMALCEPCHQTIHQYPKLSYEIGTLAKSYSQP